MCIRDRYELHPVGGDMKTEADWDYLRDRLDQAYKNNRIVITIHHHTHAADDPNPPVLSTRVDLLKKAVDYAQQKGFRVVTISELYALLTGEDVYKRQILDRLNPQTRVSYSEALRAGRYLRNPSRKGAGLYLHREMCIRDRCRGSWSPQTDKHNFSNPAHQGGTASGIGGKSKRRLGVDKK